MAGGQRTADDLLRLGDVEPALGLAAPPQGDVGEPDVVVDAGVVGVGDPGRHPERLEDERADDEADSRDDAEGEDPPSQALAVETVPQG